MNPLMIFFLLLVAAVGGIVYTGHAAAYIQKVKDTLKGKVQEGSPR
jgi:hypothetical protein